MLANLRQELAERGKVQFTVRAVPGAAKNRVMEVLDDESVKIAIAAPAERGKANTELVKFLAGEFAVKRQCVEIKAGHMARKKIVRIAISSHFDSTQCRP